MRRGQRQGLTQGFVYIRCSVRPDEGAKTHGVGAIFMQYFIHVKDSGISTFIAFASGPISECINGYDSQRLGMNATVLERQGIARCDVLITVT